MHIDVVTAGTLVQVRIIQTAAFLIIKPDILHATFVWKRVFRIIQVEIRSFSITVEVALTVLKLVISVIGDKMPPDTEIGDVFTGNHILFRLIEQVDVFSSRPIVQVLVMVIPSGVIFVAGTTSSHNLYI